MGAQIDNKEEFEKKLLLTEEQWNFLKRENSSTTSIFTDMYYDTLKYEWTSQDIWLRKRIFEKQETFELKIPKILNHANSLVDVYDEYTILLEIKDILKISNDLGLFLKEKCIIFCNLQTKRETICIVHPDFLHIGFKLTKDIVTSIDQYGWEYSIFELEYAYGPELSLLEKENLFKKVFSNFSWTYEYRYGKVIEYIRNFAQEHFNQLTYSGVCSPYAENIAMV